MLGSRSHAPELMDDPSVSDEKVVGALRELDVINRWLGGFAATRKGIRRLMRDRKMHRLKVLDIGAGGAQWPRLFPKSGPTVEVTALDINDSVCRYRRAQDPQERVIQGDARTFDFDGSRFDIVHASLFCHHFPEGEIVQMLRRFLPFARCGIVINDLRRSTLALAGITALTQLFSRNELVRFDAPQSVRRGFSREELEAICRAVPASAFRIERTWAFRWLVVIEK